MKVYSYDLDKDGFDKLKKDLSDMKRSITTQKFKKYLAKKCLDELVEIQKKSLSTINTDEDVVASEYMNSNHVIIGNTNDDTIFIYNDAMIDVSAKTMSESKKLNYPNLTLSLAKLVEYGMGYTGLAFTPHQEEVEDWLYDIGENPDGTLGHGSAGWYYKDNSGQTRWSNGFAGRMIFYQLKEHIKEKIMDWIAEYWVTEKSKSL